jgi:L-threonylcarbamoyladenylate synthase
VINVSGDNVEILRPGSVTRTMLLPLVEKNRFELHTNHYSPLTTHHAPLLSPGQLESHYAPSIPVRINSTHVGSAEALIAFGPTPIAGAARTINLSERGDLVEAATHLFAALRELDDPRYPSIAVMPIPDQGIGEAINDRLKRAAS